MSECLGLWDFAVWGLWDFASWGLWDFVTAGADKLLGEQSHYSGGRDRQIARGAAAVKLIGGNAQSNRGMVTARVLVQGAQCLFVFK